MSLRRWILFCLFTLLTSVCWSADDWLPISTEELKMMSEPKAPGAPAVFLYRQVERDDLASHENLYYRIKILTEEGRKYADVEIPFLKYSGSSTGNIKNIQARTIHPDGRIVTFDGQIYEKITVKARGFKLLVKTFTLPDVQPGSIILSTNTLVRCPTRRLIRAGFSTTICSPSTPSSHFGTALERSRVGPGLSGCQREQSLRWRDAHGVVRMEIHDIPAFQIRKTICLRKRK